MELTDQYGGIATSPVHSDRGRTEVARLGTTLISTMGLRLVGGGLEVGPLDAPWNYPDQHGG